MTRVKSSQNQMKDSDIIRRLFSLLSGSERRAILLSLCVRLALVGLDIVGLSLIGLSVSMVSGTTISKTSITGKFIGWLASTGLENTYAIFAFGSVAFFLMKALLSIRLNTVILNKVAALEAEKSSSLFGKITNADLDTLAGLGKKELFIGLVDSFEMSVSKLIMSFSTAFGEAALLIGIGLYLIFVNWFLLVGLVAYFGILGYLMHKLVARRTREASSEIQKSSIRASEVIFSTVDNYRQLRSLGKFSELTRAFSDARLALSMNTAKMSGLSVMPRYITEIALMLGFGFLILQRSLAGGNAVDASTLGIFIAASFRIIASLLPLQGSLALLKQISGSSRLALELSEKFSNVQSPVEQPPKEDIDIEISVEIRNLSYTYQNGRKVFSGVNLSIGTSSYTALIGKSGSGKSTLADIILGLRQPSLGSIKVNGIGPREFIEQYPGAIAYVPQRCEIFDDTLSFNVALGKCETPLAKMRVEAALEAAGFADWENEFEDGLNTLLGANRRNLSGGQLQRIGLARALYANPKMLILDESTSALDEGTEESILRTLDEVSKSVAILAIAHRGQVISRAKSIYRMTKSGLHLVEK